MLQEIHSIHIVSTELLRACCLRCSCRRDWKLATRMNRQGRSLLSGTEVQNGTAVQAKQVTGPDKMNWMPQIRQTPCL